MVFLRLEVKVYPREQAPSGPGLFRSLIGNNADRAREEAIVPKKHASFLLAVDKPEEVTLGDLACMILDEWRILRPDQEPLAIKKLLDDANPSVDLNVGLTVEDVFVDRGRARADGHDQRATVRVIQKPTAHCPERFPSVVQDWDGAVQESKRRRLKTKKEEIAKRFSPIAEEDGDLEDTVMRDSPVEQRDVPVSSVETHETTTNGEPEPASDAIAGTPPFDGHGSEELGSPSPSARTECPPSQSRKRKQSPEEEAPVKNPRLEENTSSTNTTSTQELARRSPQQLEVQSPEPAADTAPVSTPSPLRNKNRIPSFASPHGRRSSISEKPADAPKPGLGLGITKSPSTTKTVMLDIPSSQPSLGPPLFPSSTPAASTPLGQNHGPVTKTSRSLQSAMRKNTPLNKNHQCRSVSFANGDDIAQQIPEPRSTPLDSAPKKATGGTPTDSGTPSSSQICYPADIPAERIEKIRAQIEQQEQEIQSVQVKLKDPNTDPRCLPPLKQLAELLAEIKSRSREKKDSRKLRDLRKKLVGLRKKIQTIEKEALDKGKESPPSTEPPLPPSASKIDRSIPVTTLNGSTGLDAAPTWSFGPTSKAKANRKPSVASSNGSHESARSQPSQHEAAKSSQAKAPSSASKSPAPASKRSSKSPVKTDTQASPSVVKRPPPPPASKEASTIGRTTETRAQKPEVIEVASTDDESDEDEESSDEGEESSGEDEDKDEHENEDKEESEGPGETAKKEPAREEDVRNLAAEPTKGPAKSFIDDEAKEASEDEDEEEISDEGDEEESTHENESSEEESSDEEENSDDSSGVGKAGANGVHKPAVDSKGPEAELDLPLAPIQSRTPAKSPAQPSRPPASQQTPATKATLKGLLKSQRAEAAARQKQQPPAASRPPEKEKRDVYDVPSSESESGSDSSSSDSENANSDQGDILPNGDSGKLRKPWSLRK